jgi:hypothetical protein
MPRRNRNARNPMPDTDDLAAELAELADNLAIPWRPAPAGHPSPYQPHHPEAVTHEH